MYFSATGQLNPIIQIIEPILDNIVNEAVSEAEMVSDNNDTSYSAEADISGNVTLDSIGKEVTLCTHKWWLAHYYGLKLTQFT